MRKLQRQKSKSRNATDGWAGLVNSSPYTQDNLEIDIGVERAKDKQVSKSIAENTFCIKSLTHDVEDLDQRIIATEVKINVFIRPDYEKY